MTQYRQVTQRLRWSLGPGRGERVSERPRHKKTREYSDLDEAGQSTTVVDITEADVAAGLDLPFLLRIGALEPLPEHSASDTEAVDGEGGSGG